MTDRAKGESIMAKTTITGIRSVAVPVRDQDRSIEFFVDKLGFDKTMDAELRPGFRWVEVSPPGSSNSIALVTASDALTSGIDTGIRLVMSDAEGEHASMREHGVDVDDVLRWPNVPAMFSFRDPDGNTFYLAEPGV